ncbi:hypothetical protein K438DRAFT_1969251 [Mycena galopus ATCC 62051]|nr:hypothetical protein K438DRAFT_1969251 [Mycena galopus ATCC 62051]
MKLSLKNFKLIRVLRATRCLQREESSVVPTLPPESSAVPTLPPESSAVPTLPPELSAVLTVPPESSPPESSAVLALPPESSAVPTLPPESSAVPQLPPELEREIFELCALMHPEYILRFMRVSHRTKKWLEPLLYRTLTLGTRTSYPFCGPPTDSFLHAIRSGLIFDGLVQNIFLHYECSLSEDDLRTILSICGRPLNLFLDQGSLPDASFAVPLIATLNIKFLTVGLHSLKGMPFSGPLFANLTHLTAFAIWGTVEDWLPVSQIPNLTHLCFIHWRLLDICPQILQTCTKLRVLVVQCDWDHSKRPFDSALQRDPRFVVIPRSYLHIVDWHRGISSGRDHWTIADEFIAKRNAGQVDLSTYVAE